MTDEFEKIPIGELLQHGLVMVERRERASRQMKPCPECGSVQVQLVDWTTDILRHKCRHCKHKFTRQLEPA